MRFSSFRSIGIEKAEIRGEGTHVEMKIRKKLNKSMVGLKSKTVKRHSKKPILDPFMGPFPIFHSLLILASQRFKSGIMKKLPIGLLPSCPVNFFLVHTLYIQHVFVSLRYGFEKIIRFA